MTRLLAFGFFLAAAFAWSLPFVDRAGTAALGFAFLSLSVGRASQGARPSRLPFTVRTENGQSNQPDVMTFPANAPTLVPTEYQ